MTGSRRYKDQAKGKNEEHRAEGTLCVEEKEGVEEERVLFVGDTGARTFACNEMTNLIKLPSSCYVARVTEKHGKEVSPPVSGECDDATQRVMGPEGGLGSGIGIGIGRENRLRRGVRGAEIEMEMERERKKETNKDSTGATISHKGQRKFKDEGTTEKEQEEEQVEEEIPTVGMDALQHLMPWSYQVNPMLLI